MRQARADIERAMSSAKATTRPCFTPGAGTSSYRVTTGPGRIWSIWPRTPNSCSTPSSILALAFSDSSSTEAVRWAGLARMPSGGRSNSPSGRAKSKAVWSTSVRAGLGALTAATRGSGAEAARGAGAAGTGISGAWSSSWSSSHGGGAAKVSACASAAASRETARASSSRAGSGAGAGRDLGLRTALGAGGASALAGVGARRNDRPQCKASPRSAILRPTAYPPAHRPAPRNSKPAIHRPPEILSAATPEANRPVTPSPHSPPRPVASGHAAGATGADKAADSASTEPVAASAFSGVGVSL